VLYSLAAVFSLSYLTTTLGVSRTLALVALSIGGVCNALTIPLFGGLSDRLGRRVVYGAGVVCALALAFAFFPLLDTGSPVAITVAIAAALVVHAMMYGPQAAFIAEQFPTRVRYAGSSLAYTLAGIVGGGIAPVMFAMLQKVYGTTLALTAYLAVALLITGVVLLIARERAGAELE
jgi:MFS family permease